jgi:hypothetical protein
MGDLAGAFEWYDRSLRRAQDFGDLGGVVNALLFSLTLALEDRPVGWWEVARKSCATLLGVYRGNAEETLRNKARFEGEALRRLLGRFSASKKPTKGKGENESGSESESEGKASGNGGGESEELPEELETLYALVRQVHPLPGRK